MSVSFSGRCFCVITGASQGFGRCLAVAFAQALSAGSSSLVDLVLTARGREGERLEQVHVQHVVKKNVTFAKLVIEAVFAPSLLQL